MAFSTSGPDRLPLAAAGPLGAADYFAPAFAVPATGKQGMGAGRYLPAAAGTGPDMFGELAIFEEFLEEHVQVNGICDVQCMLLWSEWVRVFRRKSAGFPALVREKEFRAAITDTFGIPVTTDGFRGPVYAGIRFIP
jgi:hypothetical protein